jgi:hypothetical protein
MPSKTINAAALALIMLISAGVTTAAERAQSPATVPVTFAVPRAAETAAPLTVSGNIVVTVNVHCNATIPAGSLVYVGLSFYTSDASDTDTLDWNGSAKVANGVATLTFKAPYRWLVASTTDKVLISLSVSGTGASTNGDFTYQFGDSRSATVALPKNGGTLAGSVTTSI